MSRAIMWKVEIDLIAEILEDQFMNPHHRVVAELIIEELFGKNDRVPPRGEKNV